MFFKNEEKQKDKIYTSEEAKQVLNKLKNTKYGELKWDDSINRAYSFVFKEIEFEYFPAGDAIRGGILRALCFLDSRVISNALNSRLFVNKENRPFNECHFKPEDIREIDHTYDGDIETLLRCCPDCTNKLCLYCLDHYPQVLANYGNKVSISTALSEKLMDIIISKNETQLSIAIYWYRYVLNPLLRNLLDTTLYDDDWQLAAEQIFIFSLGLENFLIDLEKKNINELIKMPIYNITKLVFEIMKSSLETATYPSGNKSVSEMKVHTTSKALTTLWGSFLLKSEFIEVNIANDHNITDFAYKIFKELDKEPS